VIVPWPIAASIAVSALPSGIAPPGSSVFAQAATITTREMLSRRMVNSSFRKPKQNDSETHLKLMRTFLRFTGHDLTEAKLGQR
jgi:hypothetical protein